MPEGWAVARAPGASTRCSACAGMLCWPAGPSTRRICAGIAPRRQTAAHVAAELLGDSKPFNYQPFFYSRVFNLSWQVKGRCSRRGRGAAGSQHVCCVVYVR